ncbi:MAG: zinc-binding dehydrogenase, partial [Acidimicrobiia bacterium]
HEAAGEIMSGPRHGLRVAIDPAAVCHRCEFCRIGSSHLCPEVRFAGHGDADGALREYMTWPADSLLRIPDTMAMEEAALIEPLSVALHAVDLGLLEAGANVGVFGCGPIGLMIIQLALMAGVGRVVALEPLPHRASAALRGGAFVIAGDGSDMSGEVLEATDGRGLDVVFEVAGAQESVDAAVSTSRRGGRVIVVGIPSGDRIVLRASEARRKELTIILSRRSKPLSDRAIGLITAGSVDVRSLVDARYSLREWEGAFDNLVARSGIKVMVNPFDDGGDL